MIFPDQLPGVTLYLNTCVLVDMEVSHIQDYYQTPGLKSIRRVGYIPHDPIKNSCLKLGLAGCFTK